MAFLPGDKDYRVQTLILFPQSQARFVIIECLPYSMCMHICVSCISLLPKDLSFKGKINLMTCFKD